DRDDDDRGVELPVGQRAWRYDEYEDQERRRREEGHQMVPDREGEDEDHQDQQVVVLPLPQVVPPAEGQPGEERDREEADRVDLLVDVALVPDGERRGRDQGGRRGARDAEGATRRE